MRRARLALLLGTLVSVVLAGGCTADEPVAPPAPELPEQEPSPPSSGLRVGVVLPPSDGLDTAVVRALESQLEGVPGSGDDRVRELRTYRVDDRRFVGDVTGWLAEGDTDLICVLGDAVAAELVPLAALYRGLTFCSLTSADAAGVERDDAEVESAGVPDDTEPVEDGVARVEVRAEELGLVVGIAARVQADGAPVGLALGGDELPRARFRRGLLAGLDGAEVVEADVSGAADATMTDRAEAVLAAGASVVVLDGSAGASEAATAVGGRAVVFAPEAVLARAPSSDAGLGWRVRWDAALDGPIEVLLDPGTPRRTSLGFRERVFVVDPGPAGLDAVTAVVEEAVAGLVGGDLGPLAPAPELLPPTDGPPPDPEPPSVEPPAPTAPEGDPDEQVPLEPDPDAGTAAPPGA